MPFVSVVVVAALWWFEVWPLDGTLTGRHTYQPEVGYYAGEKTEWFVGASFSKREDCVSAAVATYNSYNTQSKGRAFPWACREMDRAGNFLDRVR